MPIIRIIFIILVTSASTSFASTWKKLYRSAAFVTPDPISCPDGFIPVPFLPPYTMRNFCVMKFEAKNDGFNSPVSKAAVSSLWNSIDRPNSRLKCKSLGAGFDLISNNQWQTIARNIAGVGVNWSSGIVANGELNRGHSDNTPASPQSGSGSEVTDNCHGVTIVGLCSSTDWNIHRRTHELSNGSMIWDFAGNLWEWVTLETSVSHGASGYMSTLSGADLRQTRFGAAGSTICASPGVAPYCNMGYGDFAMAGVAVIRGGSEDVHDQTGIFSTSSLNPSNLSNPLLPTTANTDIGFRCVFVP